MVPSPKLKAKAAIIAAIITSISNKMKSLEESSFLTSAAGRAASALALAAARILASISSRIWVERLDNYLEDSCCTVSLGFIPFLLLHHVLT